MQATVKQGVNNRKDASNKWNKYLDETGVNENASAQTVENAADNGRRRAVWVVSGPNTKSSSNSNRSRKTVDQSTSNSYEFIATRKVEVCKS